jgi:hypothetical protein
MPRGPQDHEIPGSGRQADHARLRREEFLKQRFPDGNPSNERKQPTDDEERDESNERRPEDGSGGT